MNELVFVYGILLSDAHVGARLDGWKLEAFGNLTVTRAEGEFVLGGLVSVSPERLAQYDRIEGCSPDNPEHGYYRRERVTVLEPDGEPVEAWVYVMNERKRWGDPEVSYFHQVMRLDELARLGLVKPPEDITMLA